MQVPCYRMTIIPYFCRLKYNPNCFHFMKKEIYLVLVFLLTISCAAKAQFAKPLPQTNTKVANTDANYHLGILGGFNATRLFGVEQSVQQPVFPFEKDSVMRSMLNHGLAGIVVERRLGENNAIGIEAIYANRWTVLESTASEKHNQIERDDPLSTQLYKNYSIQNTFLYREVFVQVPLKHYFLGSNSKVRPYALIAPRFSFPISGEKTTTKTELDANNDPVSVADTQTDSIPGATLSKWDVGAVAGIGVQFRVDIGSYYMLLNMDASAHYAFLNKPNIGNATAKLTLLFPLKGLSRGACKSWGEYD